MPPRLSSNPRHGYGCLRSLFCAVLVTAAPLTLAAQSYPPPPDDDSASAITPGGSTDYGNRPSPRSPGNTDPVQPSATGSTAAGDLEVALETGFHPTIADSGTKLSQLLPIYFPAPAPVLDSELPAPPTVIDPVWAELTPYINEPFLPPLSTRISQGPLNRQLRRQLDAHKAATNALLLELRTHLDNVTHKAPLHDLARRQESEWQALAGRADELRRELSQSRFLNRNPHWSEYRNWRLGGSAGKRSTQELLYDEFSVLRAAIYYQEGLSLEQRQLLREIACTLGETLGNRDNSALPDSFAPASIIYFLPHGSRIRLPDQMPPELVRALDDFSKEKAALKRELRNALVSLDRESDEKRERQLKELAAKQEPRFTALTAAAEQIRLQLAALPSPPQPAVQPGLSPELVARIDAYLREKSALQVAAQKQARDSNQPADNSKKPLRRSSAERTALIDFENQNRDRLAALSLEAAKIREEVASATSTRAGEGPAKSVDALLSEFMRAFKHQQLQAQYRDYRTAVLEPGLSPGQRQLLFNAALVSLELIGDKDWQAVPE